MDKDATNKGVSEEQQAAGAEEAKLISGEQASLDEGSGEGEGEGLQQTAESPREAALRQVNESRKAEKAKEREEAIEQGFVFPSDEEEKTDADDKKLGEKGQPDEKLKSKADAGEEDAAPVWKGEDGEWLTTLKVNGEEKVVPYSKVRSTAQKSEAADSRLHQASETLRQAESQAQKIIREAQEKAASLADVRQPSSQDAGGALEKAKAIIDEITDGDPDKATEMLANALESGRSSATSYTPEDIQKLVNDGIAQNESRRTQRNQVETLEAQRVEALDWYKSEHPDLAGKDILNNAVDQETIRVLDDPEFQGASIKAIFEESVRRVRDQLKEIAPAKATSSRQSFKESATKQMATGGGQKQSIGQDPAPPRTAKQVLEETRRARGQIN